MIYEFKDSKGSGRKQLLDSIVVYYRAPMIPMLNKDSTNLNVIIGSEQYSKWFKNKEAALKAFEDLNFYLSFCPDLHPERFI